MPVDLETPAPLSVQEAVGFFKKDCPRPVDKGREAARKAYRDALRAGTHYVDNWRPPQESRRIGSPIVVKNTSVLGFPGVQLLCAKGMMVPQLDIKFTVPIRPLVTRITVAQDRQMRDYCKAYNFTVIVRACRFTCWKREMIEEGRENELAPLRLAFGPDTRTAAPLCLIVPNYLEELAHYLHTVLSKDNLARDAHLAAVEERRNEMPPPRDEHDEANCLDVFIRA